MILQSFPIYSATYKISFHFIEDVIENMKKIQKKSLTDIDEDKDVSAAILTNFLYIVSNRNIALTSRSARAQECNTNVNTIGGGFDYHFHFLVTRQSATLISATQHAMPPEIGEKWETEES